MDGKEGDGLKLEKLGGLSPQPLSHIASCVCTHSRRGGIHAGGGIHARGGMYARGQHAYWVGSRGEIKVV